MPQENYSFERFLNVRSAYGPSFSRQGRHYMTARGEESLATARGATTCLPQELVWTDY